jgi:Ca-activated chloride channel family protein
MKSNGLRLPAAVGMAILMLICLFPSALYGSGSALGMTGRWDGSARAAVGAQQDSPPPRRDPPPFDRPPLGSNSRQSDQQNTSDSTRDSGPDYQPPPSTANKRPPVLRRSDDAPPEPAKQKPTLGRPSDPGPESAPSPAPASRRTTTTTSRDGGGDEVVKLNSTLVTLPLLVSDRSGRFVPQLTKRDFDLYEDNVRQEVAFFGNEEVPFNVALLLDVSPSVSNSLREIQNAGLEFVRQLRPQDRVMIVSFDHHVNFLTDFTSDRRTLERAINSTSTGDGTSVYEAVYDTVARHFRGIEGRKAMLLMSDGIDTTSRKVRYEEAINIVTESDVLVYGLRFPEENGGHGNWPGGGRGGRSRYPYPVPRLPLPWPFPGGRDWPFFRLDPPELDGADGTGAPGPQNSRWGFPGDRNRNGRDFMSDVAEAGGGPVYDAVTISDMSRLARQIADELRHVYVISYYPTNSLANGGYRSVRVKVKGRDDIAVRHRRGYNARDMQNSSVPGP